MTIQELRETVRTMKGDADERVRLYGQILGVDAVLVEAVVRAVGEISVDEAFAALEREAGRARYHAHLDVCTQCRDNPFDQCATGARLLRAAVDASDRP